MHSADELTKLLRGAVQRLQDTQQVQWACFKLLSENELDS